MTRTITAALVAVCGLCVARAGQGIMTTAWDGLWAGAAVASVLAGLAILAAGPIHHYLLPVTRRLSRQAS